MNRLPCRPGRRIVSLLPIRPYRSYSRPSGRSGRDEGECTMDTSNHYTLVCANCGLRTGDDGLVLSCPYCGDESLLSTDYSDKTFTVTRAAPACFGTAPGFRFIRRCPAASRPTVYRSKALGAELGLHNLWVAFSGYWPERDCLMQSTTFKELEAYTVLARTPQNAGVMVVASAGNTAAAFLAASRGQELPCLLVIPDRALPALKAVGDVTGNVLVIALEGATYNQAIAYSREMVLTSDRFFPEGGVRNVGRRDGLAVVALTAYENMGVLPDFYFQAVGSGAGAIATYEAARRLIESGAGNHSLPRMFLCQNAEFAPVYRAWHDERSAPGRAGAVAAEVPNTRPDSPGQT